MPSKSAEKPARKGTARTSRPSAGSAPVKTRQASAAELKAGNVKLGKPTAKRAAPKAKPKPRLASAKSVANEATAQVQKLRAGGMKWEQVAEATGLSLSALARVRATAKREGTWVA